jgi:iron complex outermembrane receptor protein
MLLRTLFTLGLVFVVQFALSQRVVVSGKVTDAFTGVAIPGASVSIPALNIGGFTDADGTYRLEANPGGRTEAELMATFADYKKLTQVVRFTGADLTIDIKLEPEAQFQTEDVVITATKGFEQKQADLTASIEVIRPKSIELQAVSDMSRVINQVPGVDNQDGQINIRGSSGYAYGVGSRVMVTLDGLPLLTGDGGTVTLDLIPVDNIAQVEVLKGASSVLYGSAALGGVINVITNDPGEKPVTSVRVRAGVFDQPRNPALDWDGTRSAYQTSAHLYHSRRAGPFSLTAQTDFIRDTGYRLGGGSQEFRGLVFTKFKPVSVPGLVMGLNLSTQIDSGGQMLYWRGYYPDTLRSVSGEDSIVGGALTPTTDNGGFRRQLRSYIALDPSIKYLTPNGHLFWYRGRLLRNQSTNNTNQSSSNLAFYNDLLYQRVLWKKVNWVAGLTYTYALANGDSLFGGIHPGVSLGVYSQLDAKFGRLNTSLGVRYETVKIDTLERESQPIFRIGLNYQAWPGANFRGSVGQAFRVPTVAERFTNTAGGAILVEPNPNIRSETGYSAELGFRQGYRAGKGMRRIEGYVDAAAFMMRFSDMVEFGISRVSFNSFPPSVFFSSVNVADARILGAEITTFHQARFDKWQFSFSGGVTRTDPRDLNAADSTQQLNLEQYNYPDEFIGALIDILDSTKRDQPPILKYRPKWLVRTSASVGYGPFALTANYRYRSFIVNVDQFLFAVVNDLRDFREQHPNGDHVVDLIASWDPTENLTFSVNIDNAFNTEYMVVPGFLAEQRKFGLQVRYRF